MLWRFGQSARFRDHASPRILRCFDQIGRFPEHRHESLQILRYFSESCRSPVYENVQILRFYVFPPMRSLPGSRTPSIPMAFLATAAGPRITLYEIGTKVETVGNPRNAPVVRAERHRAAAGSACKRSGNRSKSAEFRPAAWDSHPRNCPLA